VLYIIDYILRTVISYTQFFLVKDCNLVDNHFRVCDGLLESWGLSSIDVQTTTTRASAPLDAELLLKFDGSIVIGNFTSTVGRACKSNSVVNVENSISSTRTPDHGLILNGVSFGVGLAIEVFWSAESGAGHCSLLGSLGEIIGGDEVGSDTWVKTDISVVSGLGNG